MATKAEPARNIALVFNISGSTRTVVFTSIRDWSLRAERKVVEATNNDSSAWRELVTPSSSATTLQTAAGQRGWSFHAEAVYDLSTVGFGGVSARAQNRDRDQVLKGIIAGTAVTNLSVVFGTTGSGGQSGWAMIGSIGHVEQVTIGGTYDKPVLFDMVFRGNRAGLI